MDRDQHEAERQHARIDVVERAQLGDRFTERRDRLTDVTLSSGRAVLGSVNVRFEGHQRRAARRERGLEVIEGWLDVATLRHERNLPNMVSGPRVGGNETHGPAAVQVFCTRKSAVWTPPGAT